MELDTDAKEGKGKETVVIGVRLPLTYRCYVHNYSSDDPLAGCGATAAISWLGIQLKLTCPDVGDGRYWHICDIDGKSGDIASSIRCW